MAKLLYNVRAYADDTAGWTADETVYPENAILVNTETGVIKKGNGEDAYADLSDLAKASTWAGMLDKPTVIAAGATAEAAWGEIQSGAIGTTATKAAAGNHNHAVVEDVDSGLAAAADIQSLAVALSARIKALETAPAPAPETPPEG